MSAIVDRILSNGFATQATADNATATATASAQGLLRNLLLGVSLAYNGSVTAEKTCTISYTDPTGAAQSFVVSRNFTNGGVVYAFPAPITCKAGTAATAALQASGTGGIVGTVVLFYTTI